MKRESIRKRNAPISKNQLFWICWQCGTRWYWPQNSVRRYCNTSCRQKAYHLRKKEAANE